MTRLNPILPSNASDASFQAWINEIHNALIAFGWVQMTGVGTQIDFATVTRPTAIDTYQGYAIYRADDALQATAPLFLKLDFGTGQATNIPGLKVQIAIGSQAGADTSGNLTGLTSTQMVIRNNVAIGATANDMRTAGDAGSFRFMWRVQAVSSLPMVFAIERDQDSSGNDTALGVNILGAWHAPAYRSQFVETDGGVGNQEILWYAMLSAQTSQAANGVVGVAPVRCTCGIFRNPMKTVLLASRGDFGPAFVQYPGVIYGVSRNYLVNAEPTLAMSVNSWNAACAIVFLWE